MAQGFVYGAVNVLLPADAGFGVTWTHQMDLDSIYLLGADIYGNAFSDAAGVRAWVEFEIVSNQIPEPAGLAVLGMGLLGLALRGRRARGVGGQSPAGA